MKMTRNQRRAIMAALLVGAFACVIAAVALTVDPEEIERPDGIIAVSPLENANEVRQVTISVEIDTGLEGELAIDDTPIPKDQVSVLLTGNKRLSFTPGREKAIERLPAGERCAELVYWPVNTDPQATSRTYRWCFTVQ